MDPPFARGERIRVKDDNGRRPISEFEGTIDQVTQQGVIVTLDNDPLNTFHAQGDRYGPLNRVVQRFFQFCDIEKI
mgnify:CR=1 FL=1